jgi:hypothetical protein
VSRDTVAPTAQIAYISSPRLSSPVLFNVTFSEPVQGLNAHYFSLTRNGVSIPLSTGLVTGDGTNFTLDLSSIAFSDGAHVLSLNGFSTDPNDAGISDNAGNYFTVGTTRAWTAKSQGNTQTELNAMIPLTDSAIKDALDTFTYSGTRVTSMAEATQMVEFLGGKSLYSYTGDSVTGFFDSGTSITIWTTYYGDPKRYSVRFGLSDLAYWGSNATLFEVYPASRQVYQTDTPNLPIEIPILVVKYFPVSGSNIDIAITGDVGAPLATIRQHTIDTTSGVIDALENGRRYHFYKDANAPKIVTYRVVDTLEFLEALPTFTKAGHSTPMTDYNAIMTRVGGQHYVEDLGVKEIWLFAYHGGMVDLWESNMAGPYGDVSNSDRDPSDLPVFNHTYTFYHYNYGRGVSECVEDHVHQTEAVLNYIDGREMTPTAQWPTLLFWGKFVGSDVTGKIVNPGCGWAHYPPNGTSDYDWANPANVSTDIEDWKPDGTGSRLTLNSSKWGGNSLNWLKYWMQNVPGYGNTLNHLGKNLDNWWLFIADWDDQRAQRRKLSN